MFSVLFSCSAEKQYKKLPVDARARIKAVLSRVRANPHKYFKPLKGLECSRLRVGDYRVLAEIKNQELIILVIKIGHRRNIYD